jgi:hypothetical protein
LGNARVLRARVGARPAIPGAWAVEWLDKARLRVDQLLSTSRRRGGRFCDWAAEYGLQIVAVVAVLLVRPYEIEQEARRTNHLQVVPKHKLAGPLGSGGPRDAHGRAAGSPTIDAVVDLRCTYAQLCRLLRNISLKERALVG